MPQKILTILVVTLLVDPTLSQRLPVFKYEKVMVDGTAWSATSSAPSLG